MSRAERRREARNVWKRVCRDNRFVRGRDGVTLSAMVDAIQRKAAELKAQHSPQGQLNTGGLVIDQSRFHAR